MLVLEDCTGPCGCMGHEVRMLSGTANARVRGRWSLGSIVRVVGLLVENMVWTFVDFSASVEGCGRVYGSDERGNAVQGFD